MKEYTYKKLDGRDELVKKLTKEYIDAIAEEVTVIYGEHGSGKSYVLFEILNKLQKNKNTKTYNNNDDDNNVILIEMNL